MYIFLFCIIFEAGSSIFIFPFFPDFFPCFPSISYPARSLFLLNLLLRALLKILVVLCPDLLPESDKNVYVFNYAFPLDSPKMIPVAIRWATLRGSGILLLIEVRRTIFSALFIPIPAFWI